MGIVQEDDVIAPAALVLSLVNHVSVDMCVFEVRHNPALHNQSSHQDGVALAGLVGVAWLALVNTHVTIQGATPGRAVVGVAVIIGKSSCDGIVGHACM